MKNQQDTRLLDPTNRIKILQFLIQAKNSISPIDDKTAKIHVNTLEIYIQILILNDTNAHAMQDILKQIQKFFRLYSIIFGTEFVENLEIELLTILN